MFTPKTPKTQKATPSSSRSVQKEIKKTPSSTREEKSEQPFLFNKFNEFTSFDSLLRFLKFHFSFQKISKSNSQDSKLKDQKQKSASSALHGSYQCSRYYQRISDDKLACIIGKDQASIVNTKNGKCESLRIVALDCASDGSIVVLDNNGCVWQWKEDNKSQKLFYTTSSSDDSDCYLSLAVLSNNTIAIANNDDACIYVYDGSNKTMKKIKAPREDEASLQLVSLPDCCLAVGSSWEHIIQVWKVDNESKKVAEKNLSLDIGNETFNKLNKIMILNNSQSLGVSFSTKNSEKQIKYYFDILDASTLSTVARLERTKAEDEFQAVVQLPNGYLLAWNDQAIEAWEINQKKIISVGRLDNQDCTISKTAVGNAIEIIAKTATAESLKRFAAMIEILYSEIPAETLFVLENKILLLELSDALLDSIIQLLKNFVTLVPIPQIPMAPSEPGLRSQSIRMTMR